MSARDLSDAATPSGALLKRAISAALMLPPVLAAIWYGGWPFTVLLAVAALVMAYEWARMVGQGDRWPGLFALVAAGTAGGIVLLAAGADWRWPLAAVAAAWLCSMALSAKKDLSRRWSALIVPHIALPLFALWLLRADQAHGLAATLWVFAIVWATDTAAYFAGRAIGGPKLAPRFSPKKTWAGLIGGAIAAGLTGLAVALVLGNTSTLVLIGLGAVLAVIAQAGDIVESAAKRYFGVKDSGALIPGHGGLLDRVDGLVTAAVAAFLVGAVHTGVWDAAKGLLIW